MFTSVGSQKPPTVSDQLLSSESVDMEISYKNPRKFCSRDGIFRSFKKFNQQKDTRDAMEINNTLSDYEKNRLANIQRNLQLMDSLGLNPEAKLKPKLPIQKKSKKTLLRKSPPVQIRKSSRIAGINANDIKESKGSLIIEKNLDDKKPKSNSLRKVKAIPIPNIDEETLKERGEWNPSYKAPIPTRDEAGVIHFEKEYNHFQPNLTPSEVIRLGSFGGGYFRKIYSRVAKREIEGDYSDLPSEWFEGLDHEEYLTSEEYNLSINRFKTKAGQGLQEWEDAGWIREQDPRGWFQWYCRFYAGRRSPDDDRQIRRWIGVCGSNGRFKRSLANKVAKRGGKDAWSDPKISPQVRQTLQHWAYKLTKEDYEAFLG